MATATTKKRVLSPEGRNKIAEAQNRRWGKKATSVPPVTVEEVESQHQVSCRSAWPSRR